MKKLRLTALLLTLCMLLSVPAMAAGPVAENDKAKVTVIEGKGASVAFNASNDGIIDVTVTSELLVANEQYVIMMIQTSDDENYTINEDSILYIDQAAAAAASDGKGTVQFSVYPSTLANSVILIAGAKDGLLKVAIVEGKYVLGDVNEDGVVSTLDAVAILRRVAGTYEGKFNEQAADTNVDGSITTIDAIRILRLIAYGEALGKQ